MWARTGERAQWLRESTYQSADDPSVSSPTVDHSQVQAIKRPLLAALGIALKCIHPHIKLKIRIFLKERSVGLVCPGKQVLSRKNLSPSQLTTPASLVP